MSAVTLRRRCSKKDEASFKEYNQEQFSLPYLRLTRKGPVDYLLHPFKDTFDAGSRRREQTGFLFLPKMGQDRTSRASSSDFKLAHYICKMGSKLNRERIAWSWGGDTQLVLRWMILCRHRESLWHCFVSIRVKCLMQSSHLPSCFTCLQSPHTTWSMLVKRSQRLLGATM